MNPELIPKKNSHVSAQESSQRQLERLRQLAAGFLPGWRSSLSGDATGPIAGLLQVAAKYHAALSGVVDQLVVKSRLAHFDALGAELRAAAAARGIVVFTADPQAESTTVQEQTELEAKTPVASQPIVFETTSPLTLVTAPLTHLVLTSAASDSYRRIDQQLASGEGVPLNFDIGEQTTPHDLLIGLPLELVPEPGGAFWIELEFERPSTWRLSIHWELFDGVQWRGLLPFPDPTSVAAADSFDNDHSQDETNGFTRNGVVRLRIGGTASCEQSILGIRTHWLRARATLPNGWSNPNDGLPLIRRLQLKMHVAPQLWALSSHVADGSPDEELGSAAAKLSIRLLDENLVALATTPMFDKVPAPVDTTASWLPTSLWLVVASTDGASLLPPDSGVSRFRLSDFISRPPAVMSLEPGSYEFRLEQTVPAGKSRGGTTIERRQKLDQIVVSLPARSVLTLDVVRQTLSWDPKKAFADALPVDVLSPLAPLGESPRAGATLVFTVDSVFRRRGARGALFLDVLPEAKSAETPPSTARAAIKWGRDLFAWGGLLLLNAPRSLAGWLRLVDPPTPSLPQGPLAAAPLDELPPKTCLEAWNGNGWSSVTSSEGFPALSLSLPGSHVIPFDIPEIPLSKYQGIEGRWMRLRVIEGKYGKGVRISADVSETNGKKIDFPGFLPRTPRIGPPRIAFEHDSPLMPALSLVTQNDNSVQFVEHPLGPTGCEPPFAPFQRFDRPETALYLGFDGPLPAGTLGIALDVDSGDPTNLNPLPPVSVTWEWLDGENWQTLKLRKDDTNGLSRRGIVRLQFPGMNEPPPVRFSVARGSRLELPTRIPVSGPGGRLLFPDASYPPGSRVQLRKAAIVHFRTLTTIDEHGYTLDRPLVEELADGVMSLQRPCRFDSSRNWIRMRLSAEEKRMSSVAQLRKVAVNAVEVQQAESHWDEVLGTSNGRPFQMFKSLYFPILDGEVLEIRELQGHRAAVEFEVLREELRIRGQNENDVRLERDPVTDEVLAVWVRWHPREDLIDSTPHDRHYVIERGRGRIQFGDNRNGRIPPAGDNAIRLRVYRHGGGGAGNIPAGSVSGLRSSIAAVLGATNPWPTTDGADGDSLATLPTDRRLPSEAPDAAQIRFLNLNTAFSARGTTAVTSRDYEVAARQSSASVAQAICLRANENGNSSSDSHRIRIVILPAPAGDPAADTATQVTTRAQHQPSWRQCEEVKQHIVELAPRWVAPRIDVVGPAIVPVDVVLRVVSTAPDQSAADLRSQLDEAVRSYFNVWQGGSNSLGWLSRSVQNLTTADLVVKIQKRVPTVRVTEVGLGADDLDSVDLIRIEPGEIPATRVIQIHIEVNPADQSSMGRGSSR